MQRYLVILMFVSLNLILSGCSNNTNSSFSQGFSAPFGNPMPNNVEAVQDALREQDDPQLAQIRVEPYQNKVVLSGYVKKIKQSDTAELIARQVAGNDNVENRIIVRP